MYILQGKEQWWFVWGFFCEWANWIATDLSKLFVIKLKGFNSFSRFFLLFLFFHFPFLALAPLFPPFILPFFVSFSLNFPFTWTIVFDSSKWRKTIFHDEFFHSYSPIGCRFMFAQINAKGGKTIWIVNICCIHSRNWERCCEPETKERNFFFLVRSRSIYFRRE